MIKLSVVILTKDEASRIGDCLKSVSFADEIIVIDSHSSDNTVDVARVHGARVYSHTFTDYASQRNVGLQKARGEWVLYVDADERVSPALQDEILSNIGSD